MLVRSSADLGSIVHHSWIEAWRESAPGCSVVARGWYSGHFSVAS